jgi:Ran-binding protein 3
VPDKNAGSGVNNDFGATTEAPPQLVETSDKAEGTKVESGGDKVVAGEPSKVAACHLKFRAKRKREMLKKRKGQMNSSLCLMS